MFKRNTVPFTSTFANKLFCGFGTRYSILPFFARHAFQSIRMARKGGPHKGKSSQTCSARAGQKLNAPTIAKMAKWNLIFFVKNTYTYTYMRNKYQFRCIFLFYFLGQRPLVPFLLLGPTFFPIILFGPPPC
jgi:hypothetical protein